MFLLILSRILVFPKSDPEILAIGIGITGEPVKFPFSFIKLKVLVNFPSSEAVFLRFYWLLCCLSSGAASCQILQSLVWEFIRYGLLQAATVMAYFWVCAFVGEYEEPMTTSGLEILWQ